MRVRSTSMALCLLALGLPLGAQAQAAAAPQPPAAEEAAAPAEPSPAQQGTLTGDWGGLRSTWEERGVEAGLAITQDFMRVARGGVERRTVRPGLVEPTLALDLDRLAGWKGARAFVRGIGTYGTDPAEPAGSMNAPSNLGNAVSTFKLMEAWVEASFLDETVSVRAGLYAADAEFDVKETAGVFMNGGFGTSVDLSQSGANGPCIFPTACVGVRLRLQPTPAHYVQVAVLDGVAGNPDRPRGTQVRLARDEGALVLGEAGFQRGAEDGGFLRAAVGLWTYTARFDDVLAVDAQGDPVRRRGSRGAYALLESELFREADQTSQGLSGFVRIGTADQKVNAMRYLASGGLAYTGLFPGRDEDVTALGFAVPVTGSRYRQAQRLAGTPVASRETVVELTHRMQLMPWLSLQLDAQYIAHPGIDPTLAAARLIGARCRVTF